MFGRRSFLTATAPSDVLDDQYIYRRYYKPVLKFMVKQIQSLPVAEELTQECFLKVYHYKTSYNPSLGLSPWIWTIARNTLTDFYRKQQNDPFPLETWEYEDEPIHLELVSSETAESQMLKRFEDQELQSWIEKLPCKQKEVILLRIVRKFTYTEISKSMNLSLSAVKSLINRAKSSMVRLRYQET